MEFKLSWQALGGAVVVYYLTLVFYRLFVHPLASFPGPRLAAISRWYEGYYDVILDGQYTSKIAKLHKVYGPIVRISPHELHVNDPAFFDTLYRTDGRWDKYSWAYDAFGAKNSTIFCSDHDAHKARRRAIAPYFSKPSVAAREPIVRRNAEALRRRADLAAAGEESFNLGAAVSALTRDTANEFTTGRPHGDLDRPDLGAGLSAASQGAGPFWRVTKHVPWFGPAVRALPVGLVMRVADENTRAFLGSLAQSEQDTREILAAASSSSPPPPDKTAAAAAAPGHPTMIHAIVASDLPPREKTFARVHEEVMTVSGAGFETTASALRLILFHVYTNEEILHSLRAELAQASSSSSSPSSSSATSPPPLRALEQLPYLTAVLTEGMRLSPAVASRAARVSDRDLFYGGGWRIPAGTPVGMTALLMHTDPNEFPDPMRFDPGRWLAGGGGDTGKARAGTWAPPRHYYAPFGRGTRVCLGMHLAWAEMYLVLATLVQRFDFTIEGATAGDFEMERDNFAIGTRAGCNLMARVRLHTG
ncbi:hypothetical protein KVR01_013139 [Diaporthe batatas]|uniref:uncharacterized protein n=1 Tax=Diaporthe batatas TaxID=748121 RepID=UPI001D03C298|nr:uncharacterized protein KVR01_013139 [Diaporthe batatas]KAG8156917.1 hypothetical protein KVR01_013139 [Diaporthe batatas]